MKSSAALTFLFVLAVVAVAASGIFFFLSIEESNHQESLSLLTRQQYGFPFTQAPEYSAHYEVIKGTVTSVVDDTDLSGKGHSPDAPSNLSVTLEISTTGGAKTLNIPMSFGSVIPDVVIRNCTGVSECPGFEFYLDASAEELLNLRIGTVPGLRVASPAELLVGDSVVILQMTGSGSTTQSSKETLFSIFTDRT